MTMMTIKHFKQQKMIKPIIIIFNNNYYWFKSIAIDLQLRQKRSEQTLKYFFKTLLKY